MHTYESLGWLARHHPPTAARLRTEHGDAAAWNDAYRSRATGRVRGSGAYGADALAALADAHIVLVGGGAVGGQTLTRLLTLGAGTGTGTLVVADPDQAETSNLQRQALTAVHASQGVSKAAALVEWADRYVPFAAVRGLVHAVTPDDVPALIKGADAVVMAADVSVPQVNHTLLTTCVERGIPVFGGLDLNRTAVSWHWTPETDRSPLLRGLHRYGPDGPRGPLQSDQITTHDLAAVQSGHKVHALGWLVQMLDPADLPASLLRALLDHVAHPEGAFLPQAGVAALRQAQQTADLMAHWFDPDRQGWFDGWSYVVFDAAAHPTHQALERARRLGDSALLAEAEAWRRQDEFARRRFVDDTFTDPDPVASALLTILGVSRDLLQQGRSPLVGRDGR